LHIIWSTDWAGVTFDTMPLLATSLKIIEAQIKNQLKNYLQILPRLV